MVRDEMLPSGGPKQNCETACAAGPGRWGWEGVGEISPYLGLKYELPASLSASPFETLSVSSVSQPLSLSGCLKLPSAFRGSSAVLSWMDVYLP